MHHWQLNRLNRLLRDGGLIAYPTEAVWGLGCDPYSRLAVDRLLALKSRPEHKGLILVSGNRQHFADLLSPLPAAIVDKMNATWPGPVTWLVPVNDAVPRWISGGHSSVAIRVSAHPQIREICEAFGRPLVSTSANFAGRPALTSKTQLVRQLGPSLDWVVAGALGSQRQPSRIIDALSGRTIRA